MKLFIEDIYKFLLNNPDSTGIYSHRLSDARNFILLSGLDSDKFSSTKYDEKISFPFPVCFFEFAFDYETGVHGFGASQKLNLDDTDDFTDRVTSGIFIIQDSPDMLIEIKITQSLKKPSGTVILITECPYGDVLSPEADFAYKCFYQSKIEVGKSQYRERIKTKNGTHKINQIVYMRPSGSSQTDESRAINWTHRFEVRGHWRKISQTTIGKDRSGTYNLKGFTWIDDFIKGKGKLIIKTRASKGSKNGTTNKENVQRSGL